MTSHRPRLPRGFTLIELLVALAVLAILTSVGLAVTRPSHSARAAQAVRTAILWARTEAIWRGVPVSVTEVAGQGGFAVRLAANPAAPCSGGAALTQVALAEFPGVRLVAGLPRGLVWLPSGSGRTCSLGGVISSTIELTDARASARVVVSALGRARLEAP